MEMIFGVIGMSVSILTLAALISAWSVKVENIQRCRKDAIFDEQEDLRIRHTRELFFWSATPVIWPVVLVVLFFKWIYGIVKSVVVAAKDLFPQTTKEDITPIEDIMEEVK